MFDPKRYILAGGTVVAALAIGFLMQQSPSADTRYSAENAAPSTQTASLDTRLDAPVLQSGMATLELSGIAHTAARPEPEPPVLPTVVMDNPDEAKEEIELAAIDAGIVDDAPKALEQVNTCEPAMTASTGPAALVALEISAPCLPNSKATIHHNGMMFSVLTDDDGQASVTAPALSPESLFILAFENGAGVVARAMVPEFDTYDRVVLQWRGDAGFQVHALEYGADYGDDGHVWAEAPGDVARAVTGEGGFVTRVGDWSIPDGLRAEAYTFPTGAAQDGDVVLSAEAIVTPANCDKEIEAQALQMRAGGLLNVQELMLSVPSCDVEGNILMLKNLLEDLKIARN